MKELYVFFSANYLPHVGGVERYTYGITRKLLKCGKHVLIVTSSMEGVPEHSIDEEGAEIYRIPSKYIIGDRMPLMFPGRAWRELNKVFSEYDKVQVVIQTMLYPMSLFAVRYAKKHGYPYIVIIHGANYVCLGNSLVDKMEHLYERCMLWYAKKMRAPFFAVSHSGVAWLKKFGIRASDILYNSVDHEAILATLAENKKPAYGRKQEPNNACTFAFVGRLIAEKGVHQLVKAFEQLVAEGEKVKLFMIGDGPEMDTLKEISSEQVSFLGYCSNPNTLRILNESDCLCLPSDSEGGLPTVILEAIICGCYVITSPYGGGKEIIASSQYGYVMDGNSQEDIYEAMKFFLKNREQCRAAAAACYHHFLTSRFTWENTCKSLMNIFSRAEEIEKGRQK